MATGVGIIGAGPGVAALHMPTVARLADRFAVVHVSDGGSGRADVLAARVGGVASRGHEELLADPRVEVVAICSPPDAHAAQVLAAVRAGKRAILCEKPLALTLEDAEAAVEACRDAGTALVVGTNHHFDPAWGRAKHHLTALGSRVRSVVVTVALPPNGRYHDVVSEGAADLASAPRPRPDWSDPAVAAAIVRQLVLGLGIHDLPLLRDLVPHVDEVVYARGIPPVGYAVGLIGGGVPVQLNAVMLPGGDDTLWRMEVTTSVDTLDVTFPPPFVHAGSAAVRVRSEDGRVTEYPREGGDGYVAEWRAVGALLDGTETVEYDEILADARYAVDLADAAAEAVREGAVA
ncbi:MAG: Gfo/Idh/MocA family oxidoreductase [Microbacterium sp.]|nr:Gfo/Idh/MocA family oxidoreductase [Microbacterium sp.]